MWQKGSVMKRIIIAMILSLGCLPGWAFAQMDEIVVTATRISSGSDYEQPHVTMKRRPDNVVLSVSVICDTRDASKRLRELEATMVDVIKTAKAKPAIELGILVEREDDNGNEITFVNPYNPEKFGDYVSSGYRADTNAIRLVLKTKVTNAYNKEEDALAVLEDFIESVKTTGRTEIVSTNDPVLSIIKPGQYRYDIVSKIAKDANRVAKAFGPDYHVSVDGLESPIIFYQTGDLELTLYIPYGFDVVHGRN